MLRALQSVAVLVCLLSTQGFATRLKVKPFASKHGIVIQEFALTSSHVPEISSLQEYTSFALKGEPGTAVLLHDLSTFPLLVQHRCTCIIHFTQLDRWPH